MSDVHVVLPGDIDDPRRPSGGNAYDRAICDGLVTNGWAVHEHPVRGAWPVPDAAARARLTDVLGELASGAIVLVDGLVASVADAELLASAARLRLVVLVHMPLGDAAAADDDTRAAEGAVLASATTVVTTSRWTYRRLRRIYALPADRICVVEPGVAPGTLASGTVSGGAFLCVAAVTPQKGYDVLVEALATIADLSWRCVCVGPLDVQPGFDADVRERADTLGIAGRLRFAGPLTSRELSATYGAADLLVLPTRAETYGMVVAEALARGVPVVASGVGGVPEALGRGADGVLPGVLVRADDPPGLAYALRRWLTDGGHRQRLRTAARSRRATLTPWSQTAAELSGLLSRLDEPDGAERRTSG